MKPNLQSITANLMVEDVDKTVAYYRDSLGFNLKMSVPKDEETLQWAMVVRNDVELMLHERENLIDEVPQLRDSRIGSSLTLFVRMEGLDQYYEQVKNNTEVIKEPSVTFYGMKEFTIQDMNGYIITFAEPEDESDH